MEDAEVSRSEIRTFHQLCAKLRADLDEALQLKKKEGSAALARIKLSEGAFALLEIKSVNRHAWELVNESKVRCLAANAAIDTADLKLQNLQYQKNHFLREIRHCRLFRSEERQIELIPVTEFLTSAPAELKAVTQEEDAHKFHLNRLELEKLQRQELCLKRDALHAQQQALREEIATKRAALDGMASQVRPHLCFALNP